MNEIKEKKYVSTGELIALQLWIYYPLLIICIFTMWNYHLTSVDSTIENIFLKIGGLDVNGALVSVLLLSLLLNLLTLTFIFIILLPKSKYTYGGKNGWYSVWWNFGVQTIVYPYCIFAILFSFGAGGGKIIISELLTLFCLILSSFGCVCFIGTIVFYSLIRRITFKTGE